MATKAGRLADLNRRLKAAEERYARLRARYTRSLVTAEAAVQRLRAERAALAAVAPATAFHPLPRVAGRPTQSKHPFPVLVGNVAAWCRREGVPPSTAKLWFRLKGGRPIPIAWATKLREQYGIPFDAWPNGVRGE